MRYICSFLILVFFSCTDTRKNEIATLLNEWMQKEILFPSNPTFTLRGKDTVDNLILNKYKIINYVDSAGCTSCKLRLSDWSQLMSYIDSVSNQSVQFLFFFFPKSGVEVYHTLRAERFAHPVCIDENDSFNKLNHFPSDMMFQTFLLDKDNKVVAIGNPIQNPRVKELYLQIIMGDKAPKETARMQTVVACPIAMLDMGEFDWRQEQTGSFELTNTGNHPLVVIDAVTSCGCTSVVYDKVPIPPGKSTELKVRYKADHPEYFNKTITVHCNAEASPVKLSIKGNAR